MPGVKSTQQEETAAQKFDWKHLFRYTWVVKNIPFFLFLAFLAVLYIFNGHFADKLTRKISATEKHIKELEFEYKTVKSEVIYRSKASRLAEVVKEMGLRELDKPPVVLNAAP
jgi:cell division protein FtsL